MHSFTSKTLLAAVAGAASVAAHGHVTNIVINGVSYLNYDPTSHFYMADPPTVVGWATQQQDNGFVEPAAFGSGDIICHKGATNAGGHAVVAAGDNIFIQWDTWPESHHGPVMDYLASCGTSGCETVEKTSLEFFKIDEVGLVDGASGPGKWGSDQLIANGNAWMVKIPTNIKPGFYVLRHEIIALHASGQQNGAQNYPQCFNLQITGSGTATPAGVKGTSLYQAADEGILFDIYRTLTSYPVPGPAVINGGGSVPQSKSAVASSASAITGSGAAPAPTNAPVTTTTSAGQVVPTPTTTLATSTTVAPGEGGISTPPAGPSATALPITATYPVPTTTAKPVCGGGKQNGKQKGPRSHPRDVARE